MTPEETFKALQEPSEKGCFNCEHATLGHCVISLRSEPYRRPEFCGGYYSHKGRSGKQISYWQYKPKEWKKI